MLLYTAIKEELVMGLFSRFHSEIFSTHERQCGSCAHLTVYSNSLKGRCNRRGSTYKLSEPMCKYYIKDNSRDYSFFKDIYTYHITTLVCKVLNIDSDSLVFNTIRKIRQKLEENPNYASDLAKYDAVGPQIAAEILNDPNCQSICEDLLVNHLLKTVIAYADGNLDKALSIYYGMTKDLYNNYINKKEYDEVVNEKVFIK